MKNWKFYALITAIYAAPNLPIWASNLFVISFFVVTIIFWWLERDK